MPGYHAGRSPRNKGLRYPADPPTAQEIIAVTLLNDLGAAPEPDVLTVRGFLRSLQRPLDPVGDEVERRAPLHFDWLARVMGEDEHVVVVRRVVSPPTLPPLLSPVLAAHGPEHVAAITPGPDVLARFLDYPCALANLAALVAVGWRQAASGTIQPWSRSPPSPSGFSSLWFGPATKPSSEIAI